MKGPLLTSLACLVLVAGPCPGNTEAASEEMAIKDAIRQLLDAHEARDYEAWMRSWVRAPYISSTAVGRDYHVTAQGWDDLYLQAIHYFLFERETDEKSGRSVALEPYDHTIRVHCDGAWVQFKIKWVNTFAEKGEIRETFTFENYFLEKVEGTWKVAFVSAIGLTSYQVVPVEMDEGEAEAGSSSPPAAAG